MKSKDLTNDKLDSLKLVTSLLSIIRSFNENKIDSSKLVFIQLLEDLRRVLTSAVDSQTITETVDHIERFGSSGQLKSKFWLIQTLKKLGLLELGQVFLCAGWCGSIAYLLFQEKDLKIDRMFNFDKDPLSIQVSEDLNRKWVKDNWKFKASLKDILDLNYHSAEFETLKKDGSPQKLVIAPDTIINTSCEHIESFTNWWNKLPTDKLLILQSNNFDSLPDEHVNCVHSLKEMEAQAPLRHILFKGELDLGKYTRFMLIGKK